MIFRQRDAALAGATQRVSRRGNAATPPPVVSTDLAQIPRAGHASADVLLRPVRRGAPSCPRRSGRRAHQAIAAAEVGLAAVSVPCGRRRVMHVGRCAGCLRGRRGGRYRGVLPFLAVPRPRTFPERSRDEPSSRWLCRGRRRAGWPRDVAPPHVHLHVLAARPGRTSAGRCFLMSGDHWVRSGPSGLHLSSIGRSTLMRCKGCRGMFSRPADSTSTCPTCPAGTACTSNLAATR
ncbi:hypothetical protein SAMN04488074_10591 [Lentzea albidocapillata subsp. violacea]|uniref:Uncharacterized protein n=1 Tax=Lentzea albidocapillata subsp. violacea TaxID=128104 RepID=A0A1G9AQH2_9PSEU|nr:hypothetical protein SAMN04488074_10591 [Lentzea albidocapillata subsp. violacea]